MVSIFNDLNMKKIFFVIIAILAWVSGLWAQNTLEDALLQVEKNNPSLLSAQRNLQAAEYLNKTGLNPADPEAEMNYLWGNPAVIGNRRDFSIQQHLDFPTAYVYRKTIAEAKNQQAAFQYQSQRKQILLQARLLLIDLIYYNRMCYEAAERNRQSVELLNATRKNYEAGACNILDYNKAGLSAMMFSDALQEWESGRAALLTELEGLNGGKYLVFTEGTFPLVSLPADFEAWYLQSDKSNPELAILEKQADIGVIDQKLTKTLMLPGFSAGYMREQVVGETFQGLHFGLTIPLWEHHNKLRYAKANHQFVLSLQESAKLQHYTRLKRLFDHAVDLQDRQKQLLEKMESFNNTALLAKAYHAGEISLTDYLLELTLYYEYSDKVRNTERELHKTIAELNQYQ